MFAGLDGCVVGTTFRDLSGMVSPCVPAEARAECGERDPRCEIGRHDPTLLLPRKFVRNTAAEIVTVETDENPKIVSPPFNVQENVFPPAMGNPSEWRVFVEVPVRYST